MSDSRGQVIIHDGDEQVVLYSHRAGDELEAHVAEVLAYGVNLDSPGHVAAQIFARMMPVEYDGLGLTIQAAECGTDYTLRLGRDGDLWRVEAR